MALTKKELVYFLKYCPDNAIVTVLGQGDVIHITTDDGVLLSAMKPIGICYQCGGYVYPEEYQGLEQYPAFCPTCDENKFELEFNRDMSEMHEEE